MPLGCYGIIAGALTVLVGTFSPIAKNIYGGFSVFGMQYLFALEYLSPVVLAIIAGVCLKMRVDGKFLKVLVVAGSLFGVLVHLYIAQDAVSTLNSGVEAFRKLRASSLKRYENNTTSNKTLPKAQWASGRADALKQIAEARKPVPDASYGPGTYVILGGYFLIATSAIFGTGRGRQEG